MRALHQRRELQPRRFGMAWVKANEGSEAAVGAGDDALLADDIGESLKPFRDQLGMLDTIGLGVDHPDDKRLVIRQLHVLPNGPLVFVARIRGFEVDELRSRLEDKVDDVL